MRIAGVHASAFLFFIFFVLQVQRCETNFLCMYRNVKQQRITPRYILSDWGIPHDKNTIIHIQNSKHMKKVNEIAVINSVSLNEKLYSFNEDNETFRVALRITYAVEDSSDNKEDKDFLSLAAFANAGAVVGKSYSCIINFDRVLEGGKHTEKAQDEALKDLSAKFVGKKARFSTFDYTIPELTDGNEKSITDGEHTYSSLANTYLGNVDDEQAEIKKLKVRLADMIDDNFEYSKDDE